MANEKLTVELLAEDKGLEAGFKKSTATVEKFDESIKSLSKNSVKSISSMQIQLQSYQRIAEKATDPKILSEYNAKIQAVEKSISQASNVGKVGFDAFGNAVEKTSGSIGGKLFNGLKTAANILPGIGIAGLLAFATGPIIDYISELDIFVQKINEAKQAQLILNDAIASKEYADAVKNVNDLRLNIELAKQGFISKEGVVKQYNETIGKTTGQINNLTQAEDQLNKNAEAYIRFTLLKAAANLALESAAKKTLEAEQKKIKDVKDFYKSIEIAGISAGVKSLLGDDEQLIKERNKKAQLEKQKQIKADEDAAKEQINIARKFQQDSAKISKEYKFNFFGDASKSKAGKIEIPAVPKLELPKGSGNEAQEFEKYYKQLLGGDALKVDISKVDVILPKIEPLEIGNLINVDEASIKAKFEKIKENFDIYFNDTRSALDKFTSLQNVAQTASDAISDVGFSIGEALANGSSVLDAIGTSILASMGSFLAQFGKLLVQYGVAAVVKAKLDAATALPGAGLIAGPLAIAAGIALEVAAGAISSLATSKNKESGGNVRRFANGGIAYGPTLGLMGEYAGASSNPEVIAPLNKLRDLLPGNDGQQVFIPEVRLGNDAIYVAFKRGEKQQNRI